MRLSQKYLPRTLNNVKIKSMDVLDRKLRATILRIDYFITALCFAFDMAFLILYVVTDDLFYPLPVYICVRMLPPTCVNLAACFIGRKYNTSPVASDEVKNEACAATLCTIGSSMGIFHSFFVPLWLAPCIGMMFCGVFASRRLRLLLAGYSMIMMVAAAAFQCFERPEAIKDHMQNLAVTLAIGIIMYAISKVISQYMADYGSQMKASALREQELINQMHYEPLTGVFFSRPYFIERAEEILGKCAADHPVSLAMVDFDYFKQINDVYGHDNGDKVIMAFADLTLTITGDDILAGRYGGEEFVFIFDGPEMRKHLDAVEYLRERFGAIDFDFMDKHITLSCGIASATDSIGYEELFAMADGALYRAKEEGRNRTVGVRA